MADDMTGRATLASGHHIWQDARIKRHGPYQADRSKTMTSTTKSARRTESDRSTDRRNRVRGKVNWLYSDAAHFAMPHESMLARMTSIYESDDYQRMQKQDQQYIAGWRDALNAKHTAHDGLIIWSYRIDGRWYRSGETTGSAWNNVSMDISSGAAIGPNADNEEYFGPTSGHIYRQSFAEDVFSESGVARSCSDADVKPWSMATPLHYKSNISRRGRASRLAPHMIGHAITDSTMDDFGTMGAMEFLRLYDPVGACYLDAESSDPDHDILARCAEIAPYGTILDWTDAAGCTALRYRPLDASHDDPETTADVDSALAKSWASEHATRLQESGPIGWRG